MKRFPIFLFISSLAVAAACASSNEGEKQDGGVLPPRGQVNITFACKGNSAAFHVVPFTVRTRPDGTVMWHATASLDSVKVWGKDPAVHLFQSDTLKFAGGDHTAQVLPDSGTYHYTVEAFCGSRSGVMDPDVIPDRTTRQR
ncbi:MAG: hypothetical protein P8174_08590 [Gemmatimonadota bacterium]|jgi:hypothetical protein